MSAETKNPPPSWAGGLDEKKSYSVGLSRFQPDRVKTFEGSEGCADGASGGNCYFGLVKTPRNGITGINRDKVFLKVKALIGITPSNRSGFSTTNS